MRKLKAVGRASGVLAALATIVGFAGGASPAEAATASARACWLDIDTGVVQCFDDRGALAAAVEQQTGGPLLLADGSTAATTRGAAVPAAAYALVTFYDGASFSGDSTTVTTSISSRCTAYSFTGNSMISGWNDRVSSYQSYGTCKTRVSHDINQGGTSYGPVASAATLGSMDNQTSSYWITG